jgi:undecaprenyl-diphosphatase
VDFSILHALNRLLVSQDAIEDPLTFYVSAAQVVFAGLIVLAAIGGRRDQARRRSAALLAGADTALALGLGQVISHLVDRSRPFVDHPGSVHLFSKHAADAGFPSDHATAAFAIATAIVLYDRRWGAVALVLAAILAVGRVAIGVHYPTDVLAGAALGAGCSVALWALARRRFERVATVVTARLAG